MRKILTSVLSVAGLLAVVLALASSPASAAKEVITISSPTGTDPVNAGTYTISWETQGGCDPGAGTSGASGSVTLTVAGTGATGTTTAQVETGVVTDNICNYSWSGTFVNASGASCVITSSEGDATTIGPAADGDQITLVIGNCAQTANLAVTVKGSGTNVGDCIPVGDGVGTFDDAACTTANTSDPQDGTHRRAVAADASDSALAALATTFTITATPQEVNGRVPEGCNAVSEDTETDYGTDNLPRAQTATLTVVDRPLGGADTDCVYTVTAALSAGFAAGDGSPRSTGNSQKDQQPLQNDGADATAGTADDNTISVPDLTVTIASTKVFLVQNVIGDAGGASASYEYKAPCGAPGLPGALTATPASGGISTVDAKVVVELRTGRFNISEALSAEATATDGQAATALNNKGEACEATIAVSGVPAHCSVSSNSPASLASASGNVIIEVTVDCSEPVAPEPEAPAMDDTDDMGADDMGADDMGADDMGADDMGSDDMDDMGPPVDTPTG